MNVKSQTTVSYAYMLGEVDYQTTAISNVVSTEVRTTNLLVRKLSNNKYYRPGDIIDYTLVITNQGNYKTKNVFIKEDFDKQDLIQSSFNYNFLEDDGILNFSFSDNGFEISIGELTGSAVCIVTYKTKVKSNLNIDEEISSTISAVSDEVKQFVPKTTTMQQAYAKVICSKKALPDFTYLNTDLVYQISIKNIGNMSAYNLCISDALPQTFMLDENEAVILNDEVLNYKYQNNILEFNIDELNASDEMLIYVKGKIIK